MDEDLETFIRRYKAKIVDQNKPSRREESTHLNQMAGIEIPPQDIGDDLQQKWNVDKLTSFQKTNRANVLTDSHRMNDDFLSKLGVYEEKRRRLQALRKEEYNTLLAEKQKSNNNRRNIRAEPEQKIITPQPYEDILEKKRQEEKEYRRITNQFDPVINEKSVSIVNSDTSIMSSNFTQSSPKDPLEERRQDNKTNKVVRFEEESGIALQIGKVLSPEEIQRRKEQYRIDLKKQINEAEAKKKKKNSTSMKTSPSLADPSSTGSSPQIINNNHNNNHSNNNHSNNNNNSNNVDNNVLNVEMNPLVVRVPPNFNQPTAAFFPSQPINFQSLPTFPLIAPTPFYAPSIMPTAAVLLHQQPNNNNNLYPAIYPSYGLGTQQQQLPLPLSHFNSDLSTVMNSPLLPHYLKLLENQSGSLRDFPNYDRLSMLLAGNNNNQDNTSNNKEQQEQQSNVIRQQQEQQKQQQHAGVLEAFLLGSGDKNESEKKMKYQQELKNQIEEAKRKKQKQKEEDDNYDRKLQEELERYHTHKDPLKTTMTSTVVVTNNQDFETYASERKSNDYLPQSVEEDISMSDLQNQSNHARGGNGIFGEPMSEEQRKTKSKYQEDLLKQIEDKKRRENEERERKKREDEVFLRKVEEEKKKMEEEYEEERRKALEKKQIEDKKREEETKLREERMLMEAEKRKQQEMESMEKSKAAERMASRQSQNRQKSPPIPALRSSRQRKIEKDGSLSQDKGQVLNLLSKMKNELDLRKVKADRMLRKMSQEKMTTMMPVQKVDKQQSESRMKRMERPPEDSSGVISSSSTFTIGKAELTTSMESIGSSKVTQSKSGVVKTLDASKPSTAAETLRKIHKKSAKASAAKLQNKQPKETQKDVKANNFHEKSKPKDLKGYVDHESELLEDLLKKKKRVDIHLRRALRDLDRLTDESPTRPEKNNSRNSAASIFSTDNMTDEERMLSATSRSLREKFKEIDQRPYSVNSLDPEELSRQNEERLKRLRILTDEMISRNHDTFQPFDDVPVDRLKTVA